MNKNPKDNLLETLTIIGYTDDRDKFAEEFLNLCQQQAFLNLIQKLPKDKREELEKELSQGNSSQKLQEIIRKYFSIKKYTEALEEVTEKAFMGYIEKVLPILSASQKNNLQKFLSSLASAKTS